MEPISASSEDDPSRETSDSSQDSAHCSILHPEIERRSVNGQRRSNASLLRALTKLKEGTGFPDIAFASHAMLDLIKLLYQIRNSAAPLLLTGETGVGKDVFAKIAHAFSDRRERDFIAFNCAASSEELFESRLFGHLRGSFTGANSDFKGIIREAEGGTLFLDEIGEISLGTQPKFLRFLQAGEIQPLGMTRPIKVDARIIAATNRDFEEEVRKGLFRADLFERLNVFRIHIPPLRERPEDIPPLIHFFLSRVQEEMKIGGLQMSDKAMSVLCRYDWPRNVRQLFNEIQRLVAYSEDEEEIGVDHISPEILAFPASPSSATSPKGKVMVDLDQSYHAAMDEVEREFIIHALQATNGNLMKASRRLKLTPIGLRKAIKRLKIDLDAYRRH
jgi:DNA-binding NtrC family response regulator